jgi:hypothetical protein
MPRRSLLRNTVENLICKHILWGLPVRSHIHSGFSFRHSRLKNCASNMRFYAKLPILGVLAFAVQTWGLFFPGEREGICHRQSGLDT